MALVNAGDPVTAAQWNLIRSGITERGISTVSAFSAGDPVTALKINDMRSHIESLLSSFANEGTGETWERGGGNPLSNILAHLGMGDFDDLQYRNFVAFSGLELINFTTGGPGTWIFATGDAIRVEAGPGGVLPAPLVSGTTYYAEALADPTYARVYNTRQGAFDGVNWIDLTTAGSGDRRVSLLTWTDGPIVAGMPARIVHYNEIHEVVRELRWQWKGTGAGTGEWRKYYECAATAAEAYSQSAAQTPVQYTTTLTGHFIDNNVAGCDPETPYGAYRFRFIYAFDTSAVPVGAVVGAARMAFLPKPTKLGGRDFYCMIFSNVNQSTPAQAWGSGSLRSYFLVTTTSYWYQISGILGSDVVKGGTTLTRSVSNLEQNNDKPADLAEEYMAVLLTGLVRLMWRRDDYAFQ